MTQPNVSAESAIFQVPEIQADSDTQSQMNSDTQSQVDSNEPAEQSTVEQKRGRGRPRPLHSIQRDQAVYEFLSEHGELSRNRIAKELGLSGSDVYQTLNRLRRDKRVDKSPDYNVWYVTPQD